MSAAAGWASCGKRCRNWSIDRRNVLRAERGLRDARNPFWIGDAEARDVRDVLDEPHPRCLAQRADDLVVPRVPDQEHVVAQAAETSHFAVDLGHQGARGVHDSKAALPRLLAHGGWHAVSAEDHHCSERHLVELVDERGPRCREAGHDCALCTIARRTYTGGPKIASARSTVAIARTTPAQKPRGETRTTRDQVIQERLSRNSLELPGGRRPSRSARRCRGACSPRRSTGFGSGDAGWMA